MQICMDWRAINFDWNQIRAFLATVEEGSLSAAARALGQAQPTLGRQVAALEEALGLTLFDRVGKALVVTPSGVDLLEHVREMGEAATRISLSAAGHNQAIAGLVRLSAMDSVAAYLLPAMIETVRAQAPAVTIEVISSNTLSDLRRREADIAIRHVRPDQPDLVARKMAETTAHCYASPAWIARHGHPATLADLSRADFIGVDQPDRMIGYLRPLGLDLTVANFPILSANTCTAWEMVRRGLGVGFMMKTVADRTGGVVCIDPPGFQPIRAPIWLVTHRELHTSRRIRLVFDLLAEALGG